jgi:CubicO group peptidase (beta-lactamase class C family)
MRRDHVASVGVAVVQDGQVVLNKGYGFAGPGRPIDPDATLFRIGWISKTFTWIAAMKEVEAGRMRLDAPINAYLPPEDAVPDAPGWRQVELNDLMSHTVDWRRRGRRLCLGGLGLRFRASLGRRLARWRSNPRWQWCGRGWAPSPARPAAGVRAPSLAALEGRPGPWQGV